DVLTPAEWRVLEALRDGGTNAEIGARLGISADAVKYHISNMLGKLELRDRRALAAWRPEERRGRLPAWFAAPAAIGAIARPVAWVGIGTVAAAGVVVGVVAVVGLVAVVLVVVAGGGDPPTVVRAPLPTPEATSPPPNPSAPEVTPTLPPTVTPHPVWTLTPTPTAIQPSTSSAEVCDSIDCIEVNPCRGVECVEADRYPYPCSGYDCIESVPNAFERRIFEPGESIDWEEGVYFFDVETGRMEAYRLAGGGHDYHGFLPGARWVVAYGVRWDAVLHRETGRAWRFPDGHEERFAELLRAEVDLDYPGCIEYPGQPPPLGQPGSWGALCEEDGPARPADDESSCQGRLSPDGRHVAQQWGQPAWIRNSPGAPVHGDPSVVIADAETCAPLFRIRPAYAYHVLWEGQWLADSEGFVVGTDDGYAILRVIEPEIVHLPGAGWGPIPAPTGDGRYFLNDFVGIYDRQEDRWLYTGFREPLPLWTFEWGETEHEVRYALIPPEGSWGYSWNLASPTIEFPPFEEVAFRVGGAGGCLDLRSEPSTAATVLDCITEGTRVQLVVPPKAAASCLRFSSCLPATSTEVVSSRETLTWVYVLAHSGGEGWVAYSSLEALE
ncbi:MAG: LuxR C-terminal-related transcriptional regulator, partial [Chloroflexota bacterium]|nr:LuxR C-terminal-related transcriptional regulator [Chloroflexota bacterium]